MRKQLQFRFGSRLYVHVCASNTNNTLDGVVAGGKRIAAEIEMVILGLEAKTAATRSARGNTLKHLSFVGHCTGGLYARYAATLLDEKGLFAQVRPHSFTTFATPHLGQYNFHDNETKSVTEEMLQLRDSEVQINERKK